MHVLLNGIADLELTNPRPCSALQVSQTNPHIVPLVNFKSLFPQWWASFMEAELKHRCVSLCVHEHPMRFLSRLLAAGRAVEQCFMVAKD